MGRQQLSVAGWLVVELPATPQFNPRGPPRGSSASHPIRLGRYTSSVSTKAERVTGEAIRSNLRADLQEPVTC
jgi:hypothetical protein